MKRSNKDGNSAGRLSTYVTQYHAIQQIGKMESYTSSKVLNNFLTQDNLMKSVQKILEIFEHLSIWDKMCRKNSDQIHV